MCSVLLGIFLPRRLIMHFTRLLAFLALEAMAVQASITSEVEQLESLASSALTTAYGLLENNATGSTCNALNVQVRKEW